MLLKETLAKGLCESGFIVSMQASFAQRSYIETQTNVFACLMFHIPQLFNQRSLKHFGE